MTQIIIGDEEFPSVASAKRRASAVLRRWVHDERFIDGDDLAFVKALFLMHPDAMAKAGAGVVGFFAALRPGCRTANLYIARADGSTDDFSIKRCLDTVTNK